MNAPTSTISTFTHREPKAWKAPEFESPLLINARDLKPLGQVRGFQWFTHPKHDGELVERSKRLTDRDIIPSRLLVQVDEAGERSYRIFDIYAPGTFAASADTFGPPPPASLKFADALPPLFAPRKRPKLSNRIGGVLGMDATVNARDRDPIVRQPRVRIYGPAAILADLARRGIVISLGTDNAALVVRHREKLMSDDIRTMMVAAPLIRAFLQGGTLSCVVGSHGKDESTEAVSLGLLGAACCLRHAQERG